jgi:hypothetical protein
MLLAVWLMKAVSWVWFVVLSRKVLKQSSVFITFTIGWSLLPFKARPWYKMSESMSYAFDGNPKPAASV